MHTFHGESRMYSVCPQGMSGQYEEWTRASRRVEGEYTMQTKSKEFGLWNQKENIISYWFYIPKKQIQSESIKRQFRTTGSHIWFVRFFAFDIDMSTTNES